MTLAQLKRVTSILVIHVFRPGTNANHIRQAKCYIDFCNHYQPQFLHSPSATIRYYITHITSHFTSSKSICNYVSRVQLLHSQLSLIPEALDTFPITSLLREADLTMRTPPLHHLPSCLIYFINSTSFQHVWVPSAQS